MVKIRHIIFFIVTFAAIAMAEEEQNLTLTAEEIAIQLGESGEVTCTPVYENWTVEWYAGGEVDPEKIIPSNDSLRIYAINGTLTINDANFTDSGQYSCNSISDENTTLQAEVHVYVMPSYFMLGMIIIGINAGLVVIFIVCGIYTYCDTQRRKKEVQRGRRKTAV